MSFSNRPLVGRRVLLIESAAFLASYVAESIEAAGGTVIGRVGSVEEANLVMSSLTPPDAAIINAAVIGASEFLHRGALTQWGVPVLVIRDRTQPVPSEFDCLTAPFASYQVVDHICAKLGLEPTQGLRPRRAS